MGVPRAAWIVLSVAVAAVVVLLTGAAFLIGTGTESSGETGTEPVTPEGAPQRLQLPLARDPKALMLAREAEPVLVGLAARPGGPVEVGVLDGEQAVDRARLSFRVGEAEIGATPCGFGCYRLRAPVLDGKAQAVSIVVDSKQAVSVGLPARLPPSGSSLFRRAERSMRSLRSYSYRERLSSGVGAAITTQFQALAPNRLQLRTSTGSRTVIIGGARWDKVGARWERSTFPGLSTRSFMWDGAFNARVVGTAAGGARVLTAFDFQPVPAWFRLTVGPEGRVHEAEMIAASHFMTQGFSRFNAPIKIQPPQ
jgi:hypothetical protein